MNPAGFCSRAFPKHTYFRRKEAHDGLDLSSLLHTRTLPDRSGQQERAAQIQAEGCADCPFSLCLREPIWGPSHLVTAAGGQSRQLRGVDHAPQRDKRSVCTRYSGNQIPGAGGINATGANPLRSVASRHAAAY